MPNFGNNKIMRCSSTKFRVCHGVKDLSETCLQPEKAASSGSFWSRCSEEGASTGHFRTAAFMDNFSQQVRALAGTRPKKVLAKMTEEVSPHASRQMSSIVLRLNGQEEVLLTREEFRRGLPASQLLNISWKERMSWQARNCSKVDVE